MEPFYHVSNETVKGFAKNPSTGLNFFVFPRFSLAMLSNESRTPPIYLNNKPQKPPVGWAAAALTGTSAWIAGQATLRLTAKAVFLACVI